MRTLNCKRMTRMMSLYIAGDLSDATRRAATLHLATCELCRRLAEEFSETSALLTQACASPEFDAEFYTGIRRAVISEIAHSRVASKSSRLGSFWGSFWGRRWVYATALAIAVISFGIVLQSDLITREPPLGQAFIPPVTGPQQKNETNWLPPPRLSELQSPRKPHRPIAAQREQREVVRADRVPRENPSQLTATIRPKATDGSASPLSEQAPVSEISQIEIQTADPNIRIIWFTPRDSRKSEEIDHSQYQDEDGDEE